MFILIPGAGGVAWYWHRVVPLLPRAVAVELPCDDPRCGLQAYADRVVKAIGRSRSAVLVAQSLGGFTAAAVAARVPVRAIVFVNAMIPKPGERVGDWSQATGSTAARVEAATKHGYPRDFDEQTYFFHDVPAGEVKRGARHERNQSETVFDEVCPFERWPDVPMRVLAGRDDRLFPIEFQRRVARERLGLDVEELPGGHLVALSHPRELAASLLARNRRRRAA